MTHQDGQWATHRQFGNILADGSNREVRGWRSLDTIVRDIRFAVHLLRRNPLFTLVATGTLGVAIGANTVIFSLIETAVLRQLPYAAPEELFTLDRVEAKSQSAMNCSYPDFRDWQQQSRSFGRVVAYRTGEVSLTGSGEPEYITTLEATPGLLELLGIRPILGRPYTEGEGVTAVDISHSLWLRHFGGDPAVIGRIIHLKGQVYTVSGVLHPDFHFPPTRSAGDPEIFLPISPNPDRTNYYLHVIGRLAPGVKEEQARAEMNTIAAALAQTYPTDRRRQGIEIHPLSWSVTVGSRETCLILLAAVVFVLLIACANVACLLLSQGTARRRELAIRVAVGADRARLVRQLLTESLLLAGFGGVLGILLARWGLPLVASVMPARSAFYTRVADNGLHINGPVLAFSLGVSVLAGMLFGLLPAWKCSAPARSSEALLPSSRSIGSLIAVQVAISFVLLAGAGLMTKALLRLLHVDLGFRTQGLLTISLSLPQGKYQQEQDQVLFYRRALREIRSVPGVLSASVISDLPLTGEYPTNSFEIEGGSSEPGSAAFHAVSPDYFRTMKIPLVQGRLPSENDMETALNVVVVNRSLARRYWKGAEPLGKVLVLARSVRAGSSRRFLKQRHEVVGVVDDTRFGGSEYAPMPELYIPYPQYPRSKISIVLRTTGEGSAMQSLLKQAIWRVDPEEPIFRIATMDDLLALDLAPTRFVQMLIGAFALVALALAGAGIYGVASYSVRQRTPEIAIRKAIGAGRRSILGLVIRWSAGWVLLGTAGGTCGALALTRLLTAHLYTVKPTDPIVFASAGLLLAGLAVLAAFLPAWRATLIDPLQALRCQ